MAKTVTLHGGDVVPALGQGTWLLGEEPDRRREEIETLREGIERGLTLIDTAEMYGDGSCEEMLGEALAGGWREKVYLVSKVYPHNATRLGTAKACERSLRRLRTDVVDLYLLHWRGDVPLAETMAALVVLQQAGKLPRIAVMPGVGQEVDTSGIVLSPGLAAVPAFAAFSGGGRHRIASRAELGAYIALAREVIDRLPKLKKAA